MRSLCIENVLVMEILFFICTASANWSDGWWKAVASDKTTRNTGKHSWFLCTKVTSTHWSTFYCTEVDANAIVDDFLKVTFLMLASGLL